MADPIKDVPVYGWESILRLAGLATTRMLREDRKQPPPGQKPAAQYWATHSYAPLYRIDEAVDLPPLSPGRQHMEGEVPVITSAPGDSFGKRYDNWVGQLSGSYRWNPRVAVQPSPWEPIELIAEMRLKLAAMAAAEVSDGA